MLSILVPVLSRPARVAPLLASIAAATPEPHEVLFLTDPDDLEQRAAVQASGAAELACGGSYARKINAGCVATGSPWVFLGADDLHFHPGWLLEALRAAAGGALVIGTNDLGNARVLAGEHATHSLVHRDFILQGSIDDPSVLLHEGYSHSFVDDELVATARARDAWAFAPGSVVEHLHPDWGKGEPDTTYELGQAGLRHDRRLHRHRRHLWT